MAPCESSPPAPNHNDAASALMALAGNIESSASIDESSTAEAIDYPNPEKVEIEATSPPLSPGPQNNNAAAAAAAAAASRFPNKLMSVLESDIYSHIITWSPDGKSFVFLDSNAFERIVLPSIFKVAKFDSFLRKLYRWGFSKCQTHSKVGCPAYKHEKFLRDKSDAITEMECRSKPKTQYGNAAPMTLNAFHQSAPQLSRNARDAAFQNTISNAVWEQVRGLNPQVIASGNMDIDINNNEDVRMGDAVMVGHQNHQLSGIDNQQRVLENARAALLNNATSQSPSVQSAAQRLLNANNLPAVLQQRQQLLNQQAASMGHSLIAGSANAGSLDGNQQVQDGGQAQSLSGRCNTTPFNMKFMEQPRPPSAQNSTFQLGNLNQSALMNAGLNTFSQLISQQEHAQNVASNPPQRNTNIFLEQVLSSNTGVLGMQDAQNVVSNMMGVATPGNSQIDPSVAEFQALQQAQAQATQALSPNSLVNGMNPTSIDATMSPASQTLQLLRLSEERNRLTDEVRTRIRLQNEVERMQLQNEVGRQLSLQNNLGRQAQLQDEVNRFRLLNEVDRQMRVQNEATRQARLQNDARLALIAKLARDGNQSFGR